MTATPTIRTDPSAPRGFTLIETMMAAALGTLLVLACMAMFGAMDRTETATARRYDETTSMARVHLVMDRVFGDLLILGADAPAPTSTTTRTSATSGTSASSGRSKATSDFKQPDAARNGEAQAEPRPRVSLDLDLSPQVKAAMAQAGMDSKGNPPQRLEVVTSHAPIPAGFGSTSTSQMQASMDSAGTMASRSVFELRPDAVTPRDRLDPGEKLSDDGKGWTLWWRPLPPTEGLVLPDPYTMDPTQDPAAVRVAVGLVQCNWQVFKTVMDPETNKPKGREKVPAMTASQLQDLPAYVEMKATTASGLSADWMFEVGWGYGPETTEEAGQDGAITADAAGTPGQVQFTVGVGRSGGGPGGPGQVPTTVTGTDGRTTTFYPGGGPNGRGPRGQDFMIGPGNNGPRGTGQGGPRPGGVKRGGT